MTAEHTIEGGMVVDTYVDDGQAIEGNAWPELPPWTPPPELRPERRVTRSTSTSTAAGWVVVDGRPVEQTRKLNHTSASRVVGGGHEVVVSYGPDLARTATVRATRDTLDAAWWRKQLGAQPFRVEHYPRGAGGSSPAEMAQRIREAELICEATSDARIMAARVETPEVVLVSVPGVRGLLRAELVRQGSEAPIYAASPLAAHHLRGQLLMSRGVRDDG